VIPHTDVRTKTLSQLTAPAGTYLCFDAGVWVLRSEWLISAKPVASQTYIPGQGTVRKLDPAQFGVDPNCYIDFTNGRHALGANVAFGDGHVKYVKAEQVIAEATKRQQRLPNAWDSANP
jgi:prepilin-type processing-associated H-X9-DG protein